MTRSLTFANGMLCGVLAAALVVTVIGHGASGAHPPCTQGPDTVPGVRADWHPTDPHLSKAEAKRRIRLFLRQARDTSDIRAEAIKLGVNPP